MKPGFRGLIANSILGRGRFGTTVLATLWLEFGLIPNPPIPGSALPGVPEIPLRASGETPLSFQQLAEESHRRGVEAENRGLCLEAASWRGWERLFSSTADVSLTAASTKEIANACHKSEQAAREDDFIEVESFYGRLGRFWDALSEDLAHGRKPKLDLSGLDRIVADLPGTPWEDMDSFERDLIDIRLEIRETQSSVFPNTRPDAPLNASELASLLARAARHQMEQAREIGRGPDEKVWNNWRMGFDRLAKAVAPNLSAEDFVSMCAFDSVRQASQMGLKGYSGRANKALSELWQDLAGQIARGTPLIVRFPDAMGAGPERDAKGAPPKIAARKAFKLINQQIDWQADWAEKQGNKELADLWRQWTWTLRDAEKTIPVELPALAFALAQVDEHVGYLNLVDCPDPQVILARLSPNQLNELSRTGTTYARGPRHPDAIALDKDVFSNKISYQEYNRRLRLIPLTHEQSQNADAIRLYQFQHNPNREIIRRHRQALASLWQDVAEQLGAGRSLIVRLPQEMAQPGDRKVVASRESLGSLAALIAERREEERRYRQEALGLAFVQLLILSFEPASTRSNQTKEVSLPAGVRRVLNRAAKLQRSLNSPQYFPPIAAFVKAPQVPHRAYASQWNSPPVSAQIARSILNGNLGALRPGQLSQILLAANRHVALGNERIGTTGVPNGVPMNSASGVQGMLTQLNQMSQADVDKLMSTPHFLDQFTPNWLKRANGNPLAQFGIGKDVMGTLATADPAKIFDAGSIARISGQLRQANRLGNIAAGQAAQNKVYNEVAKYETLRLANKTAFDQTLAYNSSIAALEDPP